MRGSWTLFALWMGPAHAADDASLYAAAPPAGSAFVRVIQADLTSGDGTVGATAVRGVESGEASAYVVAPQGSVAVGLAGAKHTLEATAGGYYSVVWLSGTAKVFEDTPAESRTKALLTVYNLSDQAEIRLTTGDGAVEIVGGVAPAATAQRALNALAVPLSVYGPSGLITAFPERVLDRGAAYSVIVTGIGDRTAAHWVQSRTSN